MTLADGMKLDSKRMNVIGRCAWRALVLTAGMAAMVSVGLADDGLSGLSDPTRPSYIGVSAGTKAERRRSLLQSTFVSENQRRAVIGGRTYAVGDRFGGAVIAQIEPYEVVLKQAGRERHLRMLPRLAKDAYVVKVPANSREGEDEK